MKVQNIQTTWLQQVQRQFNLTNSDLISIGVCLACGLYFLVTQPLAFLAFALATVIAISVRVILHSVPLLERIIGVRIRTWHIASFIAVFTVIFGGIWEAPASAALFQAIEDKVNEILSESGIDTGVVAAIFTFFRILVILAFLAGGIVLATQAFQGGNWQPLAQLMGIGIGFVIAVEVLTRLVLGTAGGGTP